MATKKDPKPTFPDEPGTSPATPSAPLRASVAPDEINEDPAESQGVTQEELSGFVKGLEAAAVICETRFAGIIGNMCATGIREERAAVLTKGLKQ